MKREKKYHSIVRFSKSRIIMECNYFRSRTVVIALHREHSHLRNKTEASPSPSSPIKHLKGSPIRNGSRNAQLTPNYPTGVVGHRVITFTIVPFKTRLFMYSHFAAVRAFMVSGASAKAATIKSSMAHVLYNEE